jgi:hypothetical protein
MRSVIESLRAFGLVALTTAVAPSLAYAHDAHTTVPQAHLPQAHPAPIVQPPAWQPATFGGSYRDPSHVRWRTSAARAAEPMVESSRRFARAIGQAIGYDTVKPHAAAVAVAADAYHRALVSGASPAQIASAWRQLDAHQRGLVQSLGGHQFTTAPYLQAQWDALRISHAESARLLRVMPAVRLPRPQVGWRHPRLRYHYARF